MAYQSQDIIRRSATNGLTPAPQARDFQEEVAKLIDVTTCIGCKACQVACSEWNDIRDTVGNNIGVYDNPNDLSAKSWTVMRFSEVEQNDKLEWLIRKDGCMHCSDPGCLKACPAEGPSQTHPPQKQSACGHYGTAPGQVTTARFPGTPAALPVPLKLWSTFLAPLPSSKKGRGSAGKSTAHAATNKASGFLLSLAGIEYRRELCIPSTFICIPLPAHMHIAH